MLEPDLEMSQTRMARTIGVTHVPQVPVTHAGRAAAVVLMLFMPIIIAFITASTTKSLNLTPDETTLMRGRVILAPPGCSGARTRPAGSLASAPSPTPRQ